MKEVTLGPVRFRYIAGNCPIQAEGEINTVPFYFRGMGDTWYLAVGKKPTTSPEWRHEEFYGVWPDAGWMPEDIAISMILKAAAEYMKGNPGAKLEDNPDYLSRLADSIERISRKEN